MPDPVYLSLWLKDFQPHNMLPQMGALMGSFPVSSFRPGIEAVIVRAISDEEPEVSEEAFEEPVTIEQALKTAESFLHDDGSYEFVTHWDLWQRFDGEWLLRPQECRWTCFAPHYQNDTGDHIRIALGWEDQFLADPADPASTVPVASNLRSIARLAESLQTATGVDRRLLWSTSPEGLLSQLEETIFRPNREQAQ